MLKNKSDLINFIENDAYIMSALKAAQTLNLPQWFLGAGIIRNTVWDILHGNKLKYLYNDIDLGYYDAENQSEKNDEIISQQLRKIVDINWEIVNQAYAHIYSDAPPYHSALDGLAHWIETATAVGATLDSNGRVVILDPWGVEDLLELKLRLSPCHKAIKYYEDLFSSRIKDKNWHEKWPKLKVVTD